MKIVYIVLKNKKVEISLDDFMNICFFLLVV